MMQDHQGLELAGQATRTDSMQSAALNAVDLENGGVYCPPPPCCMQRCTTLRACGETSTPCRMLGEVGVNEAPFGIPRHKWMYTAAIINTCCLAMLIAGAFGISTSESILADTYWSSVDVGPATLYIGPNAIYTKVTGPASEAAALNITDDTLKWSDIDCDEDSFDPDQCDSCKSAASGTVATAIVGTITTIPAIQTDIQRSTRAGDLNCQKFMALFTGLAGGLSSMVTLLNYADGCWNVSGFDTTMGPGFILQLIGTILKFVDIPFHMLLQTPPSLRYHQTKSETS